jgi:hypothetical protein
MKSPQLISLPVLLEYDLWMDKPLLENGTGSDNQNDENLRICHDANLCNVQHRITFTKKGEKSCRSKFFLSDQLTAGD